MNNLCLIAIDLDQTLLRLDKSYDTERFNQVYRDLSKKGVLFAIISGHNRQDTNNYIDAMETEKMYIASHNGNHVVYQNELTHKELIPSLQVRRILKHLNILDRQSILLDDGDLVYSYHVEADHQKEIVSHYPKIKDGG